MKKILLLAALLALGHKGWTYYQAQNVQPRYAHDYLAVYGRDSCGYTQGTLQALRQAGVRFEYLNIDDPAVADGLHARMTAQGIDTRHYLLPVVDLSDEISVRPNNAELVRAARAQSL
ncbi:hypothetical protein DMO17_11950 [Aquipseudomonas alcaligenes]|uniref:Glutaredoxin domain-containing protein n=1 Tax=Aquipseudomonas alcaligenes TaxID=43263 RepID=A0A2V4LAW5_AQUAC|nr:glutaredoxin domain-containing protein [Pseudomonas alcaligenes]PYC23363.1 hypothetical protein DMO17_11950 [Pseudomonas alcaligenes]